MTLSTVHRVKGMEWEMVAVFGVNAGILPHRLAEDVEEERRVLHVALTRCRRQVVLLCDASRPSPMLPELTSAARVPRVGRPAAAGGSGVATAGGMGAGRGVGGDGAAAGAAGAGKVRRAGRGAGGAAGRDGDRERAAVATADPVLEQALRTWRGERSRRDGVPAYIVMHDATLSAIAIVRPSSLRTLRRIDGIGPAKLELYGEEILAVLAGVDDGPRAAPATP